MSEPYTAWHLGDAIDRIEALESILKRISEATTIPEDKRGDVDFLRAAVMLAHVYAGAALSPQLSEVLADLLTPELPGLG